ncbi:MAG: MFS transporter [Janthinobacterium lividum]
MSETYRYAPAERPLFAGSPFTPVHSGHRRLIYLITGVIVSISSTFPNALTTVNVGTISGSLGLYVAEASILPAVYVALNASANLTLVKARAQFGIPQVTGVLLILYVLAAALQLAVPVLATAVLARAVNGLAAAGLVTLGIYYMMQALPPEARPLGLVAGIGLPQIGTPLARLIPVDLLASDHWRGLHLIELAAALAILALITLVRLPPSERSQAFEPIDLVTIGLATAGMLAFTAALGLGRLYWWTDAPQIGVALAAAIVLLSGAAIIEACRARPLVHLEWIGTLGIVRFAGVALIVRIALAEQTYGSVGLLTAGGLTNDQLHTLFALVALAMAAGIVVAAATLSERRLPWQIMVASLIIALGAAIDSNATSLTRPPELYLSQSLIGFGTTLFAGPALVYGFLRMIQRGGDHLVSFVVLFSTTQNVGGLMGSALLGTLQTIWTRNASNVFAAQISVGDPQASARLGGGSAALSAVITDPAQRAAQGAGLLGQSIAREGSIVAFNDTFHLVETLALATAGYLAVHIGVGIWRRRTSSKVAA